MKLITGERDSGVVKITTKVDADGDVSVNANGVNLLIIGQDGIVYINSDNGPELLEMGFDIQDDGEVHIV